MSAVATPADVRWQASKASQDGFVRHVVFSHLSGQLVMTQPQARAFGGLVVVDATYFCGTLISKASV